MAALLPFIRESHARWNESYPYRLEVGPTLGFFSGSIQIKVYTGGYWPEYQYTGDRGYLQRTGHGWRHGDMLLTENFERVAAVFVEGLNGDSLFDHWGGEVRLTYRGDRVDLRCRGCTPGTNPVTALYVQDGRAGIASGQSSFATRCSFSDSCILEANGAAWTTSKPCRLLVATTQDMGNVGVKVDTGDGLQPVAFRPMSQWGFYRHGDVVLDETFARASAVSLHGTSTNAWVGEVHLTCRGNRVDLRCRQCDVQSNPVTALYIDGNGSGPGGWTTGCWQGRDCILEEAPPTPMSTTETATASTSPTTATITETATTSTSTTTTTMTNQGVALETAGDDAAWTPLVWYAVISLCILAFVILAGASWLVWSRRHPPAMDKPVATQDVCDGVLLTVPSASGASTAATTTQFLGEPSASAASTTSTSRQRPFEELLHRMNRSRRPDVKLEILQHAWRLLQDSNAPDRGVWVLDIFVVGAQQDDEAGAQSAIAYVGKVARCSNVGFLAKQAALEHLERWVVECPSAGLRRAAIYELGLIMAVEAPVTSITGRTGEAQMLTTARPHGFCEGNRVSLRGIGLQPPLATTDSEVFVVRSCEGDSSLTLDIEPGSHVLVLDGPAAVIRAEPQNYLWIMNRVHDTLMRRWRALGEQHFQDSGDKDALKAAWEGALGSDISLDQFWKKVREDLQAAAPAAVQTAAGYAALNVDISTVAADAVSRCQRLGVDAAEQRAHPR